MRLSQLSKIQPAECQEKTPELMQTSSVWVRDCTVSER